MAALVIRNVLLCQEMKEKKQKMKGDRKAPRRFDDVNY
jgi:hypothetical protein